MSSEKPELKPAVVDKSIPVQYDMGNLALYDPAPLDSSKISAAGTKEEYLKSITRDNVQLLINQVLSLPLSSKNVDGQTNMTLVELPEPVYQLPREKSLPKPKEKTKWEKFAEAKGIRKTGKKDKQIYDETAKEWGTKWGYKGKNKATEDQWLVEVNEEKEKKDDNGDLIDPRKLSRMERKKLVKKNMLQQKRNRERE